MRRGAAGAFALLALLLAGCGAEDAQQEAAREEVQAHLRELGGGGYDADDVHCTDAASTWFREVETDRFVCAVRRTAGGCDWFDVAVDRQRRRVDVRLEQRDAGCTLPY
ncbi:MAG TPA: hypothetical protein VEY87_09460 [Gaiellaceae bacterium]|nr:hypothetical protein [Gaiellaceae bacterium]